MTSDTTSCFQNKQEVFTNKQEVGSTDTEQAVDINSCNFNVWRTVPKEDGRHTKRTGG